MENLARYVDKEEKTERELIIRAYLLERISQVANTALLAFLSAEKPLSKEEGYTDDLLPCWSHRYGNPNMVINRSIVLACAISSSFERLHLTSKQ